MMAGAIPLASTVIILLMSVLAKRRTNSTAIDFIKDGVHLMVDKVIDFQNASFKAFAVAQDTFFKGFHDLLIEVSDLTRAG